MSAPPTPPFAGLAELCRLADLQAAHRTAAPPPTYPGCEGDQLAILAAEIERAGKDPASLNRRAMSTTRRLSRFRGRRLFGIPLAAAAAVAALALAGGGSALAVTELASASHPVAPAGSLYGCVSGSTRTLERVYTVAGNFAGCPSGSFAVTVESVPGKTGATGPQGKTGPAGPEGPAGSSGTPGTPGTPGASAVTNVTAATEISNWPDTGGAGDVWALDNWTRTLNVTVENQVNNSHCNGAPACYAVFGTITDSGTSVPQDGKAAPNNSEPATITAADITQITSGGAASFQFYATSDAINAKNVPATDDAATQGKLATTTDWGELAFPAGTQFSGVTLTAYDWNYSAAVSYVNASKTSVSCNQAWNDGINPGDDGQGAADGNVTGTCPAS